MLFMNRRASLRGNLSSGGATLIGQEKRTSQCSCPELRRRLAERERFRTLLDQSKEAIFLVEVPSGRLVDVNESACHELDYSRRELLSLSIGDLVPLTISHQINLLLLEEPTHGGQGKILKAMLRKRDGGEIPVEMSMRLASSNGTIHAVIAARDITERNQAEEALRRERDKAQKYLDVAGVILVVIDADQRVSLINKKGCQVLGYKEEEIVGQNWFEMFLPEWSQDAVKSGFMRLMAGEVEPIEYFENPVVAHSGEERMVAWHNSVLRDEEGRIIGTLSSGEDITERKRAEMELWRHREHLEELVQQRTADLMHSEEKYRTLVENVPLIVYRIRPSGEILFVNHVVEEMFGYSREEIYRDPGLWTERIYEEDRGKVEKLRQLSFQQGSQFFAEYRVKHKDGHTVYVVDHAIPFREAGGLIRWVDGIIRDLTGRKKLQEELLQAEGIRTLSQISARLAHEIRNPLASAGGFARRLLSSMSQNDPDREKMEIIVKEVGRLETILRMILTYIQPLKLDFKATDPNRLVEDALLAVDREIKERGARLDLRLARRLPEISVDRAQMELVLETLVRRALNQMPEGAALFVSTSRENDRFQFAMRYPVHDMLPDDVEHFFYPFITPQTGYDTKDLPNVENLVHRHGGIIEVKLEDPFNLFIQISLPLLPLPDYQFN